MTPILHLNYGIHTIESLLTHHPERIKSLLVLKGRHDQKIKELISLANDFGIAIELVDKKKLDKLSQMANHQGIIAICSKPKVLAESELFTLLKDKPNAFLLILDGVQDPHNLGACFRSAAAAGVDAVIAPKDKSVGITPVVSKIASGALEIVPFIQVTNLARTLEELKKRRVWIYGADLSATKNLYQVTLSGALAIVLGGEGEGLRRLTRECCDELVNIPMQNQVESLNVSVAAGIFLFEVVRQRLKAFGL